MSYIMVSADFPGVTSSERTRIYNCLEEKNWKKVEEPGRDISTVWFGYFGDDVSETTAIARAKNGFIACSEGICEPKLAIHWGPNKPTIIT